jgi:D-alanyl-D-alanine carboxypeptidase
MKPLLFVVMILTILLPGCQSSEMETAAESTTIQLSPTEELNPTEAQPTATTPPPTEETVANPELEQALQAVVDAQVEAGFPGAVLMVDAPDMNFSWKGAAGMADVEAKIPMEPETPFRIQGITNTMIAALILKLAEEDMVGLDDPISQYLDASVTDQLNGPNGELYGEEITVRQLLNGTSGVAGYFFAGEEDRDGNFSPDFVDIINNDPDKVWQPEEVIAYTTSNLDPNFAPGEAFAGSELEYLLLGLVVEEATGMGLDEAYQAWLFEPLGMVHTFMVQSDDSDMNEVAHVYYNKATDVSGNASLSWFRGDVVSTVDDLILFMRALADDALFSEPASKEAMTEWTSMASGGFEGLSSGLGILYFDFGQTEMPEIGEILFHTSVWNGFVYYWPTYNIVFVGTLNQVMPLSAYADFGFPTMMAILPYVTEE